MLNKKTIAVVLAVAGLSLLVQTQHASAQATLIEKGASKATIYLEATAPSSAKLAATELQTHLKLVTGVQLPIITDAAKLSGYVIYLGDTAFARQQGIKVDQLPSDGYRIVSNKKWMIVAGKDYKGPVMVGFNNPWRYNESYNTKLDISAFGDAGTLFGVYHFLERYCGVRWYMPGPLGIVAPPADKLVVPAINLRKAPVFEHRHAYFGFMERSDDDALWYRRAGYGTPAPIQVSHSLGQFFHKYKDTHPEYFALIDGQRDFTNLASVQMDGTYNLSDPGFIQQAITDINKYFDENPTQKIFPLCPPDGMTRISEDPVSQAQLDKTRGDGGEFSNYVWGFVNTVAKGVAKKHPDKLVGCIAYSKYNLPPTNIQRLEPNVAVVLCKLRVMYPDPKVKKETQDTIKDWSKKASTIYNWEYYCNSLFNPNWQGYPMFFTKLLQDDLKGLRGVSKGEFIEAESWTPDQYVSAPEKIKINYPGLQHPLLYVTARLLWDPNLNTAATLDEYYRLFYGSAEKPMREFWELVESNWNKKSWHSNPGEVYDSATTLQLLDLLKEAQKQSQESSVYRKRVDLILSEFSPAAEVGQRLTTLSKPIITVPALAPEAVGDGIQPLRGSSAMVQLLDRSYNVSSPATHLQLGWDAKNLYVDLRCYEPNMDKVKALATGRDSSSPPIWEDDEVEVFLSPDPADPSQCIQYIVNANGAVFDAKKLGVGKATLVEWNGNAKVVTKKEATRWVAQLAIPWTDLGITNPQAGQKLMANVYRSRQATGVMEQSSWAPLQDGAFYSPQNFGTLTLGAPLAAQLPAQNAPVAAVPPMIRPVSTKDYGSGASLQGFYGEGGINNVGLFVGQPNVLTRNDRAICRFDLRPLLEVADRIEKVELQFYVDSFAGEKNERSLNIQHLRQPSEEMGPIIVGSADIDDVTTLTVTAAEALIAAANKAAVIPRRIDVTKFIKADLAQGHTSATFRWRDVLAEQEGNPQGQPAGFTVARNESNLPALFLSVK